ncbi:LysR family transcriptional regulator [Psychrobacillus sp. FSL K6-1267]|uniref:LysR family transcriptional regulator n=1 Tax=Psychrobacillus sp. FSL K6-1267 TaxID=2921543 RepID=UPI0030F826F9
MEYHWLKTFCVAADTLNFRKASEKLMVSQPSVTVHIKLLEEYLGTEFIIIKVFSKSNIEYIPSDSSVILSIIILCLNLFRLSTSKQ